MLSDTTFVLIMASFPPSEVITSSLSTTFLLFFQIKSFIINKLSEVDIRDLATVIQISSMMSLAMNDATELDQEAMVSEVILVFFYSK